MNEDGLAEGRSKSLKYIANDIQNSKIKSVKICNKKSM